MLRHSRPPYDDRVTDDVTGPSDIADPRSAEVEAFWVDARIHAKLNRLAAYWGPVPEDSVMPPASAFGGTRAVAHELADLIVGGTKTATSSAVWDYEAEGEPLPERGGLEIVLDGDGRPRALIATTHVEVVPFDQVPEEHARLEGEGDLSLAHWRRQHEGFFTRYASHDKGFARDMPVLLQRFEVLYAAPHRA